MPISVLVDDYRTLKQASNELGTSYHALRMFVYNNKIPTQRVGDVRVVRLRDLSAYQARGTRKS